MPKRQKIVLALLMPVTLVLAALLALALVRPTPAYTFAAVEPRFDARRALTDTLQLQTEFPDRMVGSAGSLAAREWLAARFDEAGLPAQRLPFTVTVATRAVGGAQIYAIAPPGPGGAEGEIVLVTANYDTAPGGGQDNAAGLAVVLELARLFAEEPHRRTFLFMASDSREAGLAWGAKHFSERYRDAGRIVAALDLPVLEPDCSVPGNGGVRLDSAGFHAGYAPLWLRLAGRHAAERAGLPLSAALGEFELIERAFPFRMTDGGMLLRTGIPAIAFSHALDGRCGPPPAGELLRLGSAAEHWLRAVDALDTIPPYLPGDFRVDQTRYIPMWAADILPVVVFLPLGLATLFAWRNERPRLDGLKPELFACLGVLVAGLDGYAVAYSLVNLGLLPHYEWFPARPGDPLLTEPAGWAALIIYGTVAVFGWFIFGQIRGWGRLADRLEIPHRRVTLLVVFSALVFFFVQINAYAVALLLGPAAYSWVWIEPRATRWGRLLNLWLALGGALPMAGVIAGLALTPGLGPWWWFLPLGAAYGLYPFYVVGGFILGVALFLRFARLGLRTAGA